MIVGEEKDIEEIVEMLDNEEFESLLIVGCGTCVTVSMAGGEREVNSLAEVLRLKYKNVGKDVKINTETIKRQCDFEFVDKLEEDIKNNDLVLSLACGVGVQHLVERYPDKIVLPGLDTSFYGANIEDRIMAERCIGCGECVLDKYFGICPVARCSKSLLNGPCGGSQDGKCEVDPDTDCAWELIYNRAVELDKLDELIDLVEPKNWEVYRDGGPRTLVNKEYHED